MISNRRFKLMDFRIGDNSNLLKNLFYITYINSNCLYLNLLYDQFIFNYFFLFNLLYLYLIDNKLK